MEILLIDTSHKTAGIIGGGISTGIRRGRKLSMVELKTLDVAPFGLSRRPNARTTEVETRMILLSYRQYLRRGC